MKKLSSLIVFLWAICSVFAQDLTISFQPKVSGTPIDSVQATNLRTNQLVKLAGGESLVLVKTITSINPLPNKIEKGSIYPNPADENATLCFSTDKAQQVEIRMYNANGQILNQKRQSLLQGTHRFELKFPVEGIYFVSLLKSDESTSYKAICTGKALQNSSILYSGSEKLNSQRPDSNQLKRATTDKTLSYTEGDFIHYSISSGLSTTILTETPTVSKTFEVEFVSCIDKDNKSYKVVKIGNQWWMAENLAYLPAVYKSSSGSTTDPYYYVGGYYGTDVAAAKNKPSYAKYGVLYNWPAAKAACPPGWHLPSDAEWKQLGKALGMSQAQADGLGYLGTDQGTQMKATSGWNNNGNGTNSSGFAGLPGGYRWDGGTFGDIGIYGTWWSNTEIRTDEAMRWLLYSNESTLNRYLYGKGYGFSVRYIRDSLTSSSQEEPISDFSASVTTIIKEQSVNFTDKSNNTPTSWLWDFGDGTFSTEQSPWHSYSSTGIYSVSLKVTNNIGNNTKTFTNYITVTEGNTGQTGTLDIAGKTYRTIIINGKEWMAENLAYLPAVSSPSVGSSTEPYYYVYDYDGTDVAAAKLTANYSTYGVLYNWPAAKAACPPGWHLPSDAEWTELTTFLGGESVAGGKLKETNTTYWNSPNAGATNEFGFAALPAGTRYSDFGWFFHIGILGHWWSSTEYNTSSAWFRMMGFDYTCVYRVVMPKEEGYSVRYVRD